ncbi:reverse transcriptase domain-containing protein [Tanacetum coccineum]|uniref:Reverse transcriptase domain-containing protein n=1 Tax=Tanacetum coccineum TaxID=301880 RepID=A0ABQ5IB81_9ASTR
MFKKIHVDITLADALILMPKYQKMLKSLLSNKEKLNEMANTPVSENCSAIILKKLPEKLGDPGQFLIPCNFSELKCKALADLGASINLMPFSVYTKLGLPALQSTRMTLELANCSLCVPKGIARDVLVPVGRFTFPADFVVVDFECNYQVPLILGRPFLRTARVLIDVHGEELVIRDGMERIVFKPDGSQDKESIHMIVNLRMMILQHLLLKWATNEFVKDSDEINHEVFKSNSENDLGIHDNKEEEIAFLDGLLEDENFFNENDKKGKDIKDKKKKNQSKTDKERKRQEKDACALAPPWNTQFQEDVIVDDLDTDKEQSLSLIRYPMADDLPMSEQHQAPTGGFESAISITNNQRYPDVPNTTIKLLLFPFSLDGVAKTWLDKEPPNSILTWDDLNLAPRDLGRAAIQELLRKCPHHGFSLMHQLDTFYNSLSYNDQDSLNSAAGGNFLYKESYREATIMKRIKPNTPDVHGTP